MFISPHGPAKRGRRGLRAFLVAAVASALCAVLAGPVVAGTPAEFVAANERAHSTQMEWWYITGHLTGVDPDGNVREYGMQSTFFKNHPAWGLDGYAMHMAVTDRQRGTYTYGNKNGAGFTSNPRGGGFDLGLQDWELKGKDGENHVYGNVNWGDYVLDVRTTPNKPAALHGGDGYVDFAPFGDSGYYSWTRLGVSGTVWDHGTKVTITGGQAWMDHQWFNGATKGGWDWYSIQLDNGVDYMVFLVKGPDGQYSQKFGTRVAPDGSTTELTPSKLSMTSLGTWKSPRTGRTYTSGWKVNVPDGTFTVTPVQRNQESTLIMPPVDYWEGAATVSGTVGGQSVTGKSYTEITPVQCICGF